MDDGLRRLSWSNDAALQDVVASTAFEVVVAGATNDRVIAVVAIQAVVAALAGHYVVATCAADHIVVCAQNNPLGGTIAAGTIKPGETIMALPSQKTSKVESIVTWDGNLPEAFAGQAITLTLVDEIDFSGGDVIVMLNDLPTVG